MADTKQNITELPIKVASGIAATDYLLGIDAGEGYQMLIQDLGDYIIQNVTSALGGAAAETLVDALAGKVPAPDEDGTAGQVLRTNGDGTTEWEDNASAEEIAADVTDWLDEHVAGGTTLAIDNTLTISGAAADSKAAGDRIGAVGDSVDDLVEAVDALSSTVETVAEKVDTKAPAIYSTASGALATFPDGADDMPIKSLTVGIESVQAGTGDPSPENVRPITGWNSVKATRTGKNIFGGTLLRDAIKASVPSAVIDETAKTITYAASATVVQGFTTFTGLTSKFKANTVYTVIMTRNSGSNANMRIRYTDNTIQAILMAADTGEKIIGMCVTNASKTVKRLEKEWASGNTTIYYEESGIFEGELTADDFTPYTGDTYDISLPTEAGTVYGGTLDVTAGTLTVTHEKIVMGEGNNLFTGSYGETAQGAAIYTTRIGTKQRVANSVCSHFEYSSLGYSYMPLYTFCGASGVAETIAFIFPSGYTKDTANAWLADQIAAGTPVEIIRQLATPQTYTLDPTTIRTLLGYNAMWADCGDVENVTYPADTKMYIDGLTQPDSDMVADANIQSGKYFSVNNKLYLATAAIAAGEAIVPGTNCTGTSLADALNTIDS